MNDDLNEVGIDSPERPRQKTLMSSYLMKQEQQQQQCKSKHNSDSNQKQEST